MRALVGVALGTLGLGLLLLTLVLTYLWMFDVLVMPSWPHNFIAVLLGFVFGSLFLWISTTIRDSLTSSDSDGF